MACFSQDGQIGLPGTFAKVPSSSGVSHDYLRLLKGYSAGTPIALQTEQQYKPGFISSALSGAGQAGSGLLGQYGQDVVPGLGQAQLQANQLQRYGDVNDLFNLGPAAADAVRGLNPQSAQLMDQLNQQATLGLQLGTALDPNQTRQITDAVRGNWASRGLGVSGPALADEVAQLTGAGLAAQQQRQQFALGVQPQNQQFTMPALGLATQQSTVPQQAQAYQGGILNFAQGAGPTLTPSQQSYDIFNTRYNAGAAANIAAANNQAAILGSMMSY